jgi:hypothetical protein
MKWLPYCIRLEKCLFKFKSKNLFEMQWTFERLCFVMYVCFRGGESALMICFGNVAYFLFVLLLILVLCTVRNIFIWNDGKGTSRKKIAFLLLKRKKIFFSYNSHENFPVTRWVFRGSLWNWTRHKNWVWGVLGDHFHISKWVFLKKS